MTKTCPLIPRSCVLGIFNAVCTLSDKIKENIINSPVVAKIKKRAIEAFATPSYLISQATVPFSQKTIEKVLLFGGACYAKYCLNQADYHAVKALQKMKHLEGMPGKEIWEAIEKESPPKAKGTVSPTERAGKLLQTVGDRFAAGSEALYAKGKEWDDTGCAKELMGSYALKTASYPVGAASYAPTTLGLAMQETIHREPNDPRRIVAEKIFQPLLVELNRMHVKKGIEMASYATVGAVALVSAGKLFSWIETIQKMPKAIHRILPWIKAGTYLMVVSPPIVKGLTAHTGSEKTTGKMAELKEELLSKNPQLLEIVKTLPGVRENQAGKVLGFLIDYILENNQSLLNGKSTKELTETLGDFSKSQKKFI